MFRVVWDRQFKLLTEEAEAARREKPSGKLDVSPPRNTMADVEEFCREVGGPATDEEKVDMLAVVPVDYAEALQAITTAMHHLNEGIPNRQPARIRAAYALLHMGERALQDFLETRGVL